MKLRYCVFLTQLPAKTKQGAPSQLAPPRYLPIFGAPVGRGEWLFAVGSTFKPYAKEQTFLLEKSYQEGLSTLNLYRQLEPFTIVYRTRVRTLHHRLAQRKSFLVEDVLFVKTS